MSDLYLVELFPAAARFEIGITPQRGIGQGPVVIHADWQTWGAIQYTNHENPHKKHHKLHVKKSRNLKKSVVFPCLLI